MGEEEGIKKQRIGDGTAAEQAPAGAPQQVGGGAAVGTATAAAGDTPGGAAGDGKLVLIWDLDETLLIFNSLLTGAWAATHPGQGAAAAAAVLAAGARWEVTILGLCDAHFFFDQLEEFDQTCLEDILRFDDGASLAGYDFKADGFPPPAPSGNPPRQQEHSPEQHAAAAHPAPYFAASGSGGSEQPEGSAAAGVLGDAAGAAPAPAPEICPGAPACSRLDGAALTKLAHRYRRVSKLMAFGLQALGSAAQRQKWEALYSETDALTGGWLSHASALLADCSSQLGALVGSWGSGAGAGTGSNSGGGGGSGGGATWEVVHVGVTSGQLIPSLAKLLLFKLGGHLPAERLWSSRYLGKQHCFQMVRERYGAGCTFVVIGDGIEEDDAAAALGWPYVRVLLASAERYPAERVLSWRPDGATGGPGLPFTQLTAQHIARAASLGGGEQQCSAAADANAHAAPAAAPS